MTMLEFANTVVFAALSLFLAATAGPGEKAIVAIARWACAVAAAIIALFMVFE